MYQSEEVRVYVEGGLMPERPKSGRAHLANPTGECWAGDASPEPRRRSNLDRAVRRGLNSRGHVVVARGVAPIGLAWCHLCCYPHNLVVEADAENRQRPNVFQPKKDRARGSRRCARRLRPPFISK